MSRANRVSAAVDQSVIDEAVMSVTKIKAALPFLINLAVEERKKFRKMGPKSVDYVQDCLVGAEHFVNSLAKDFPLDEFKKDGTLIKQLFTLAVAVNALAEGLGDTIMALGMDCMEESDEVYSTLKRAAGKDVNAKDIVAKIGRRFEKQGKKKVVKTQ